ncbi:DoxX family protein [Beijerinckia mobilis]|uniref:DoxX family protein n=1 Tax=Beijerinckia mobilis TaxID=231434 RepID=UPI0005583C62|nr:DoxX family protein [Beijerinckia mobilis]
MFSIQSPLVNNLLLLVARILLSGLFLLSGLGKITNFAGAVTYMTETGAPLPQIAAAIALVVETGIGLAVLFGILTRPLAILLALYTLVTAMIGHHFWTMEGALRYGNMLHFYKNMGIAGGLLCLAVAGPGVVSIDRLIGLEPQKH